ncbi:uncharacterized protein A4U43_C03F5490 [Asparagus officinalis]|uniref:C2H2-type domain-containing protein n=1 Tax=Asparagus officinalis TaxID=4686 RepID=A0A5P1F7L6_ASPOF|nr:uncharacterized protein A4U43_C03F5490 [Asparagus officinalis]
MTVQDAGLSHPCKHCQRKFKTLQALGTHQKAHKVRHAILKKKQLLNRAQHRRKRQIGMCTSCMSTSTFGAKVTSAIEQAYLMRLQQLAQLRRKRRHSDEPNDVIANFNRQEPEIVSDGSSSEMNKRPASTPAVSFVTSSIGKLVTAFAPFNLTAAASFRRPTLAPVSVTFTARILGSQTIASSVVFTVGGVSGVGVDEGDADELDLGFWRHISGFRARCHGGG